MEVSNSLGAGLPEKPYENALTVEFGLRNIPYDQQTRFSVRYKDTEVATYIPDLLVYDKIIVDTKVIDKVGSNEFGQMMTYLRVTGLKVGLIINFKHPIVQWKRVVHDSP